jgi:arsenite methyltransferase
MTGAAARQNVQEYYGRILKSKRDLKTNACCSTNSLPPHIRDIVCQIEPEIVERFYGCGSPIPDALDGRRVLDLGCGTGRDVYICSKLVGDAGSVIGIDMTDEQLDVAERHIDVQTSRFSLAQPNVEFKKGYMEDLAAAGVADNSVDVVISNCVINLSPKKQRVFSEALRVLKPGGELYFSDVFADRRLPADWVEDQVLLGECLAGAIYVEDFRRMMFELGIPDYRIVESRRLMPGNDEIGRKVGAVRFYAMTVRAFNLDSLEDRCEDYGQTARYLGTMHGRPHTFVLDNHHEFVTGKPHLVCGNTAAMLSETRYAPHFSVQGNRSVHYGLFPCSSSDQTDADTPGPCC